MKRDDPTPTYRGYRRQALYALSRIFDDLLSDDAVIQPEGVEDVAIRDKNGRLTEIVQVKDHTANLSASSFTPFFYERVSHHVSANSKLVVRIASFGPIGPDLVEAKNGDAAAKKRVIKTITKDRHVERKRTDGSTETITVPGLPVDQASRFIETVELSSVDEGALTEEIVAAIQTSAAGVSPRQAFEFLMWWVLTSSEGKRLLCRRDAIEKLASIGKFLAGRAAFHTEWHQSIMPLEEPVTQESSDDRDRLRNEFYRGSRVEFRHILAEIDVPRFGPMARLHDSFAASAVVVIHTASGQGKTTLALRYLKEFAPSSFRLQLKTAESLRHARQMALAIREQTEALGVPTIVYVDVRPGDSHWTELVRELASQRLIRVLVTIREEDWQRSNASVDFLFNELSLDFDESEARSIYHSLHVNQLAANHLDFEEAWHKFGARKTLLEFVYFVTQAETLTDRIKAQVRLFQDEVRLHGRENEESLLRLVAVASSFESRLDLAQTMRHFGITSPQSTLRRLEDEYFIRESTNGRLLDGFHAIRSEVLCSCLTDPCLFPWGDVAAEAVPLMEEQDLEAFLLCSFSRRGDAVSSVIKALDGLSLSTWIGICGVMRSLMWLGLREYWEANRLVADEVYEESPAGWYLMFDVDVARILSDGEWDLFEEMGDQGAGASARRKEWRKKQADRSMIFLRVRKWFASTEHDPLLPRNQSEWLALAEVMYWCGHLELTSNLTKPDEHLISNAVSNLTILRSGEFLRGIREGSPEVVKKWWQLNRDVFLERLRKEAAIAKWEESDDAVVAHYLIDIDMQATRLPRGDQSDETAEASLHDLSIERLELLSNLVAGKQQYGAIGYGHRLALFAAVHDEAEKSGVLAKNLHPIWGVQLNGLSRNYSQFRFRPQNWDAFFMKLNGLREKLLSCLSDLYQTLEPSKGKSDSPIALSYREQWAACQREFSVPLLLPQASVDEWGYSAESSSDRKSSSFIERRLVSRFSELREATSEFQRTVGNFLEQVLGSLTVLPYLQSAENDGRRDQILKVAEQHGFNERWIRLSVTNGFDACSAVSRLHGVLDQTESFIKWHDAELAARESRQFIETMDRWVAFAYPPEKRHFKLAFGRGEPFAWVLRPLRGRLENRLSRLHRFNVTAKLLPRTILWDGKPGLWIAVDSAHPFSAVQALPRVWDAIRLSFEADMTNPVQYCVTGLEWQDLVVVLTVNGRSLWQVAYRHFKSAAFSEDTLNQTSWAAVPNPVPQDVWDQSGIRIVTPLPEMDILDQAAAAYFVLMQHVQHMADFVRIPDTDEIGMDILQSYLHREAKRAEPMFQAALDAFAIVLHKWPELGNLEDDPNLREAILALISMRTAILPNPHAATESEEPSKHRITMDEMADWRDRLKVGFEYLGNARLFWMAHLLRCPKYLAN